MQNPTIGSFKWTQVTGGNLRSNEHLRLVAQSMLQYLTKIPARGLRRIGISQAAAACIDLDSIRIPDTRAARDAFELCTGTSPAFLVNHCMRTYLWGAVLAAGQRLQYDEELFYVASLLHDLGLTDNCQRIGNCVCFAAAGAQVAQQFAQSHQWPESKQNALSDAIALHLNMQVSKRQGMEAHLLHAGASLDVIGARYKQIHVQNRSTVLERYPRADFKVHMAGLMKHEAKRNPASRASFLVGIGLNHLIRAAPFAE